MIQAIPVKINFSNSSPRNPTRKKSLSFTSKYLHAPLLNQFRVLATPLHCNALLESDLNVPLKHAEIWQVVLFPSNYHTQKHRKLSKIRWKQTIPFAINCTSLITDVAGLMSINTRFNTQKRQHPHVERWSSSLYK